MKKGLRSVILLLVTRIGFKPMTCCLEGSCSIQLSYRVEISAVEQSPAGRNGCKAKKKAASGQTVLRVRTDAADATLPYTSIIYSSNVGLSNR